MQSIMDCERKCELILEWAKTATFDASTVESIFEWGREHGFTYSQETAIDNICKRWKVAAWAKKKGLI